MPAPTRPRPPRSPRKTASRPAPTIVLDAPPAYLAVVPARALLQRDTVAAQRASDTILDALADRGIVARPTLAEVEAERVRRGLRSGVEVLS